MEEKKKKEGTSMCKEKDLSEKGLGYSYFGILLQIHLHTVFGCMRTQIVVIRHQCIHIRT